MTTERAEVDFPVKEYDSGTPWSLIEWLRGPDVFGGTMGFDLEPGTSLNDAKENSRLSSQEHPHPVSDEATE